MSIIFLPAIIVYYKCTRKEMLSVLVNFYKVLKSTMTVFQSS